MKDERVLSAIMFSDIVGYTKLMGENEAQALDYLDRNRQIHQLFLEEYNGEFLKEMGDGFLCMFKSAVDAVNCAVEIQKALYKDADFQIRIGINVGDVIIKSGDILGDGVNIAARLEPLATPGGICVSETVYENVHNQSSFKTVYLGEKKLKNVTNHVRVYAISALSIASSAESVSQRGFLGLPFRKFLIALPIILMLTLFVFIPLFRNIDSPNNQRDETERINNTEEYFRLKDELTELGSLIIRNETQGIETSELIDKRKEKADRLSQLEQQRSEELAIDITAYNKAVSQYPKSNESIETAWNTLTAHYPEAAELNTGDICRLSLLVTKRWTDPNSGMIFVWVEGGCFMMGDQYNSGDDDEKPLHEVCVDSFGMSMYEVTQQQWESIMGTNPAQFTMGGDYPVEQVSWNDVHDFIRILNEKNNYGYRLPREAEWEFAASSGGKFELYAGGEDISDLAWFEMNAGESTQPVGTKDPNGLGLFDMSGNVWEWCWDWYAPDYYQSSPLNNPEGPSTGMYKVIRDGCYNGNAWLCRTTNRDGFHPSNRLDNLGFRLVIPENK